MRFRFRGGMDSGRYLAHRSEGAVSVDTEVFVELLLGDLFRRNELATSCVCEEDIESADGMVALGRAAGAHCLLPLPEPLVRHANGLWPPNQGGLGRNLASF